MSDTRATDDLSRRIAAKRTQVEEFIRTMKPRKRRLVNLSIIAGLVAAALTAGPAAGGATFSGWLTRAFGLDAPAWQLLCGAAALSSLTATVATQVLKSQNVEENVAHALSCRAKLEVLEIGLSAGQLDASQATTEYIRCVEEVSFL